MHDCQKNHLAQLPCTKMTRWHPSVAFVAFRLQMQKAASRKTGRGQRIFRGVKLLCMLIQVVRHLSKPAECTMANISPNANDEFWVIMF